MKRMKAVFCQNLGFAKPSKTTTMQELVILKRMKRLLKEYLADEAPAYSKLEVGYSSVMSKVMAATSKQTKKYENSKFKADVLSCYKASETVNERGGWECTEGELLPFKGVAWKKEFKAAHTVPTSLESDETSYLFGVDLAVLSSPTNGTL